MSLKIAGEVAVHIPVGEINVNHLPLLSYHKFQRAVKVKLLYTSTYIPVKTTDTKFSSGVTSLITLAIYVHHVYTCISKSPRV